MNKKQPTKRFVIKNHNTYVLVNVPTREEKIEGGETTQQIRYLTPKYIQAQELFNIDYETRMLSHRWALEKDIKEIAKNTTFFDPNELINYDYESDDINETLQKFQEIETEYLNSLEPWQRHRLIITDLSEIKDLCKFAKYAMDISNKYFLSILTDSHFNSAKTGTVEIAIMKKTGGFAFSDEDTDRSIIHHIDPTRATRMIEEMRKDLRKVLSVFTKYQCYADNK